MRAWLACVVASVCASGCYLQPTVFDGGAHVPLAEPPPRVVDAPVGCITKEPGVRRVRPTRWWLGNRRVSHDEIDRALASSPLTAPALTRARRDRRAALGLWLAGVGVTIGSIAGMLAWATHDEQSTDPLFLMVPAFSGFALGFASVPLSIRGDRRERAAIDDFNDAAAREDRCPP